MNRKRTIRTIGVALMSIPAFLSAANSITQRELMQELAEHFPSWKAVRCAKFAGGVSLVTLRYLASVRSAAEYPWRDVPCRVDGDFDGDGTMDAAVQLERADGRSPRHIVVVVFQRREGPIPVYAGEGADTLAIASKGKIDHDYGTEGTVRYENDAIYVGLDESAGVTLVYRNGRFLVFLTGD